MKKITDIYKDYKIMPNLALHQMRVAGVANMICDSIDVEVDKENIITACLLHDMGNIIKFNLTIFPTVLEPEGLEYWQGVQKEYFAKYGTNEHEASGVIVKEIGVSDRVIELIASISFTGAQESLESGDWGKKIVEYCDDRVTPFGVVSIEERFTDLRTRYAYKQRGDRTQIFENAIREIEKQIFTHTKIKPEDITDESVEPYIQKHKNSFV